MAETTIQWADYTFNPWVGCQRVSPGCEHCYAEAYDKRVGGVPVKQRVGGVAQLRWGPSAPRTRTSLSYWKKPLKWDREAQAAGIRKRVFCASLADVFEDRPELRLWRFDLFELIRVTPHLDWLLLTKRPENIAVLWPNGEPSEYPFPDRGEARAVRAPLPPPSVKHWPNVWLGATVEDPLRCERIVHLRKVPAAVHFLSCEPLIAELRGLDLRDITWMIVGGESGGGARPLNLEWARSLRKHCKVAGVAFFMKQLGAAAVVHEAQWGNAVNGEPLLTRLELKDRHGGDPAEWPTDLRVREFPEVRHG